MCLNEQFIITAVGGTIPCQQGPNEAPKAKGNKLIFRIIIGFMKKMAKLISKLPLD